MATTIQITVSDNDAQRILAALKSTGKTPKQLLTEYLDTLVQSYEQQQASQGFNASYVSVTVT